MPSPAGNGAGEPHLAAARGGVVMSWLEPVANSNRIALRYARWSNGKWSAPRTIVERNDLSVNWADFPSIVEDARGTLFAHWLQKSGSGYATDIHVSISRDGKTWSAPLLLNRDGKQREHGFVTLAPLAGGGVGAAWLDDGTVRYTTIDANGRIAEDTPLDARTCECCTTGMTMVKRGPVIVYRDRSAEEIRDIVYVRRVVNGWSEPRRVHADNWKINGCPVNGPQIDSRRERVVTAWFTAANQQPRVYAAFSAEAGSRFRDPVRIDDGQPLGRVDVVMLGDSDAVVSWLEQTPKGAEVRARRVSHLGKREPSIKIADAPAARTAGFPRMAVDGDSVWFAWTSGDRRIRTARLRF
jgi:hypothetical protein